jgi:PAS domain S-box-containing protein
MSAYTKYLVHFTVVFVAYFMAGRLGQATTNIRSSNLGPVWPAYGVALAALLFFGNRIWPAVASAAFVVAVLSPESYLTALGQAVGSTLAAVSGSFLLHRIAKFDNSISRLRDALALVLLGGLASAMVSATIGTLVLHAGNVRAYSGLASAWLIYWLGDSTGVLLVTPLLLTIPTLWRIRRWGQLAELLCLLVILSVVCTVVFGDLPLVPARMMAFIVLPLIIWAAIRFGVSGTALSIFVVATVATVETALGSGSFARSTPFVNGVQLDGFFMVLSLTGLTFAALYTERERAEHERAQSLRKQVALEVQVQNEERLRASEERLRLAQQAAHIGTFEWNIRAGVNTWTPELEAIYGLPPGGFGGTQKAFEKLVHPDDLAGVIELIDSSLKSGLSANGEWRILWCDGSIRWIAGRWQVFMDASGEPSRMIGVNMDVTERRRSEERLREYEKAVEGAEDMIGVIDREYRFLLANRQYLKMRNLTREQVVGQFIPEVLNKEVFETVIKPKLDECFQGKVVKYEMRLSYPTVGERDLSLSYFPIEGENGVDRVACILRDITDRKRAEEALLEMNRALEEQSSLVQSREELLKTFVKNVPAAVAMLDREMRYLQVSDRWCSDNEVEASELLGRLRYEVGPEMPERWKEVNRRALGGETLRADEDHWESGGITRWARWEVRPWKTAEGTVGGILILAEDITRRKQMEEMLSGMSRKLIESQEQERARIGRELHDDINQQLALVAVELDQWGKDGSRSNFAGHLSHAHSRITEIAKDVQALSHRLHSSKLEYLGLSAAARSFCKELSEKAKVEVQFNHSAVPSTIPKEVSLCLFRVLQEALQNATKYSGVRVFQVDLRGTPDGMELTVSDDGVGFDEHEEFSRQGLGLISMRERLQMVHGVLDIRTRPGTGTTISARVPLPRAEMAG